MQAYDLGFGYAADTLQATPDEDGGRGAPLTLPGAVRAGWCGSHGPAIDAALWPRGPFTGLPMMHALTLWLPDEYQRQGPEFPAIAFFQGEGQSADRDHPVYGDAESDDPFLCDLAAARPHPRLRLLEDLIGGAFALIWLTETEYAGGPVAPPTDVRRPSSVVRRPDEHLANDIGPNAWDHRSPTIPVWLGVRDDPNAGIAPTEGRGTGYQDPLDDDDLHPWAEELEGRCHLGGTAFPVQGMPDGLTPYYLELEEFAGLNFGTGGAQLDLESETFDWAC